MAGTVVPANEGYGVVGRATDPRPAMTSIVGTMTSRINRAIAALVGDAVAAPQPMLAVEGVSRRHGMGPGGGDADVAGGIGEQRRET